MCCTYTRERDRTQRVHYRGGRRNAIPTAAGNLSYRWSRESEEIIPRANTPKQDYVPQTSDPLRMSAHRMSALQRHGRTLRETASDFKTAGTQNPQRFTASPHLRLYVVVRT